MQDEPTTDDEFITALEALGYTLIENGEKDFTVQRIKDGGGATRLDAEEYSDALFEAWHLVKE